jgi:TRAP-type C4-dicarboxylate transport system substrate-binding protein
MRKKVVFLVLVLLFLCSTYASAEVVKLKFANYFPPMHMNSVMMGKYCAELSQKLAGKVELTQYTGGTLLTAPKIGPGIASGIADLGLTNLAYTRGRFPVMEIMDLPLGFPSAWIAGHVANDFYNKFKPKDFDDYHLLMLSTSPINVVQTVKSPVRKLKQVQGLKLRGTGRLGDTVKALGGTPIPLETPDLYDALKRGVAQGALLPLETLKGFKTGEVIRYVTASWQIGSCYTFYVAMNKKTWDSLPPDVQKVIDDFSKEFTERWTVEWNKIDIGGREYFLLEGGWIVNIPKDEVAGWIKAVQPCVEDYKKDLISKGHSASEVDSWISYVKERIEYWKGQEKAKKIPTSYKY